MDSVCSNLEIAVSIALSQSHALERAALLQQAASASDDVEAAILIARRLLKRARQLQTPQEQRQQAELDRMIGHPEDKATLIEMTDQAFRTNVAERVADQMTHILDVQGVPRFFSGLDRTMLRGFQSFGGYLPGVAVPLVKDKMRRETANVILPAESETLSEHLRERRAQGLRMNVNLIGEALIGEGEARRRFKAYLAALQQPDVECISVKISTIYSQITPIARRHTLHVLADRMELLFRAAAREYYVQPDGRETSKFVYLDMEEYRDMYLTRDTLMAALDRPGLENARAGIALQAYVPDSFGVLCELAEWSRRRVASARERGLPCQPLTVRVVKGANMEMERVEASVAGWPQAPYTSKVETDANFKRMIREILKPENADAIQLGVASHNLFDVGLAMLWAARAGAIEAGRVQFEMLEGMANHQRRAIFEVANDLLLYAPACRQEDFIYAIGYLIRRLDENTGEDNFLRHTFQLDPDSPAFEKLANGFRQSAALVDSVSTTPRRTQDRREPPQMPPVATDLRQYVNEPDTDWSQPHNAAWAEGIIARWIDRSGDAATCVPLWVAGEQVEDEQFTGGRTVHESFDPSRPGVVVCRYAEASEEDVERAVACAKADPSGWRNRPHAERHAILRAAAQKMRERRGDLIGAGIADGGKTVVEADPEVSEAIDFTEFYALAAGEMLDNPTFSARGRGVVAVVSPWNFPIAIPCGGIVAALAAGNTTILKPASDTVLPAQLICECLWDAGVPREALQMLPCRGSTGGRRLVSHEDVDVVILTGGTETAVRMLEARPDMELVAETGGKNATIVTALADRELAIKHLLHSAFSHGGQKCSATSLLLLEEEVYNDPRFRESLADAVQSIRVGSAWDLSNRVGPLIRPPEGPLLRELKELEHGEEWLVMSEQVDDNPCLYRPSVKWDVSPDSFTHMTELFGPVLGVMPYRRLEEAIELVNRTGYGLTSGLESLDDREQEIWQQRIRAGNLYINRPTTGAIVLRQPFGGVAKSAWGSGIKAGGPNYVIPLMHFEERSEIPEPPTGPVVEREALPLPLAKIDRKLDSDNWVEQLAELSGKSAATVRGRLQQAIQQFAEAAETEFCVEHDSLRLVGQDNVRRYRPVEHLRLRIVDGDRADDCLVAILAAVAVGCRPVVSHAHEQAAAVAGLLERITSDWAGRIEFVEESDAQLAEEIRGGWVDRVRYPGGSRASDEILDACRDAFIPTIRTRAIAAGRIEPLWYVTEQSLSVDYHRYGNLGRRALEKRRPVL
ncbi:proline dehydrogenase family protein [Candidatus Laterigemmans baculatus]|uniref:proline dehydrogenase family protein n=1 Tax=Candidatus Laterigemmans baculatus TaxID=2770505 RepID=UPI001F3A1149|nr:proline dehydrogenase family protein [Candidatus Laterigemmans baculatus]